MLRLDANPRRILSGFVIWNTVIITDECIFLGGGKALVNAYYNRLEDLGVDVHYQATVLDVAVEERRFDGVLVDIRGEQSYIRGRSIVLASGGFEADKEWLARAWGDAAKNFLIRGTPYNTGEVLRNLLDQGADQVGDPTQCHAVAIDGRAPEFDGGIVTRVDCVPFSVVLNKHGQRFYDEGEDVWYITASGTRSVSWSGVEMLREVHHMLPCLVFSVK